MFKNVYNWIDERLDVTPIWRDVLITRFLSMLILPSFLCVRVLLWRTDLFITVIQILSGMFLTMYYVPDIINAYASVEYLQTSVAFGQIVRGMHHWGASLVIVMMFLHTMRVFFTGSYKAPREMNWVVGMLIFFVMLGLGLTGYLLPWDNKAYFATKVTLEIANSVPVMYRC